MNDIESVDQRNADRFAKIKELIGQIEGDFAMVMMVRAGRKNLLVREGPDVVQLGLISEVEGIIRHPLVANYYQQSAPMVTGPEPDPRFLEAVKRSIERG